MKKLILAVSAFAMIAMVACQKEEVAINPATSTVQNPGVENLDISVEEFSQILTELHSTDRAPGWWEDFKKWVKSHTGNSQQFVNGQPVCVGNGGCGPCPGICFGSIMDGGSNGGGVSQAEFQVGLRAIAFSIVRQAGNPHIRRMIIEIPEYEGDFIHGNKFRVEADEYLPAFFASEAGVNSIKVKEGNYPVIGSPQDDVTLTIVNIEIN
jgi:hypothetical protein